MATLYNPRIVTDGLVLCLDAANVKSYPGSGTTWSDLSGNGNNGTLINGVEYTVNNNGVMTFDGVNDHNRTAYLYNNITNDLTMSCWFKTSTTQLCGLIGFRESFTTTNWQMCQIYIAGDSDAGTSGNYIKFDEFTRNHNPEIFLGRRSIFINTISVTTGEWIHLSVTSNSEKAVIYYNGSQVGEQVSQQPERIKNLPFITSAAPNSTSANPYMVLGGYYFNGTISSVKIYNRALSSTEIQQNFNALRGRYGI